MVVIIWRLPHSSSVAGVSLLATYCLISRQVVVLPVKAILAIRDFEASSVVTTQFHVDISSGNLHGMIWPATPRCS